MAAVVVDTDVVSFTFKRDPRALPFRRHLVGQVLVISFMTLAELRTWALIRKWGQASQDRLTRHLGRYHVYFADDPLCQRWAEVVSEARALGRPIEVADAWIAATAMLLGVPLVTNNPTDSAGVPGLTILSQASP
jgi:predicted nucleic acid-binding protein